jgi:hypothetical protein
MQFIRVFDVPRQSPIDIQACRLDGRAEQLASLTTGDHSSSAKTTEFAWLS